MLIKKFFCPVEGWDCPYFKDDGSCKSVDEGDDPVRVCADAASFWDVDEDYFVWEDENGNRYDTQELLELGYHFVDGEPVWPPNEEVKSLFIKSWRPGEPLEKEEEKEEECFEPGRPVINMFELNP